MTLTLIKDLKIAKKALSAYPNFNKQENTVRRAIEYLEQIKPPWHENLWNWINKNKITKTISLLAPLHALWIIAWLIIFWLRPPSLLVINKALKPFDFQLPSWLGSITLPLRFVLFVGFLNYRPRVLDAWVKACSSACREKFAEKRTVYDRQIHISVPVEFDRQTIPDLTPKQLRPTFARLIGCLLIWGEGGSGKTSLACQIAKWAMSEDKEARLCNHLMLPVLIEQELTSKENQSAFFNAISRQLQVITDQANPIPEELLERLLRHRRVLVIIDHLSEMSEATRAQINPQHRDFPANAFIVTSRLEEELGGVSKTLIKPLRIRRDRLSPFMEAYLTHRGKSDLFNDPEFHDACRQLTEMVGDRDITLLLAKLYAEQLIASKEGIIDEKLPDNIPDLMLSYLNELNRNIAENKMDDRIIHKYAKELAWESLKETFRPAPIQIDDTVVALSEEHAQVHLEYLENNLRLIKTDLVTKDRFKFLLDPLVEYLAGLHLLDLYGDNKESWNNFLAAADSKEGAPETIKGFLLAVRDCIIAKGEESKIPNFVTDELAKRADLDPEALEKARLEQRIQRLINQLIFPEIDDRRYAVQTLREIGPEAKAAVPALIEALKDKDEEVPKVAAVALARIGQTAVPGLIDALKDDDRDGRLWAARALLQIGTAAVPALTDALSDEDASVRGRAALVLVKIAPETKAAVPALTDALSDGDERIRENAAEALGKIGPEAKTAVPALIEALKDENKHLRVRSAETLGKIGADAKAADPALTEALSDEYIWVRVRAAVALVKIGLETKAAVPALIDALEAKDARWQAARALGYIGPKAVPALIEAFKDKDEKIRQYAAEALGYIGPKAKAAVPALIDSLKDEDKGVRGKAADALEKIKTPETRKALEEYKKKSN